MKQYEIQIKSKTSEAKHSVNITCASEVKAIEVASQEYTGFDVIGVIAVRKAHYFYNEIDCTE
jgi:hypothetical protein